MVKKMIDFIGAEIVSKEAQKKINGGIIYPTDFCGYKIVNSSSQNQCLTQYAGYNPVWLGNGKCSILGSGTDCF